MFSELGNALETLRKEEFTWDEDINFLQSFLRDPHFKALTEVNDRVANSIGFENPVGSSERPFHEVGYAWQLFHDHLDHSPFSTLPLNHSPNHILLLLDHSPSHF